MKKKNTIADCPCGSGASYAECCGPLHAGAAAPDAERLMRSRYCAHVLELEPYILATWHSTTRPPDAGLDGPKPKWLGLEVKRHQPDGDRAIVEFIARFRIGGRAERMHETSRFVREDGRWFYLDGKFAE